MATELHDLAKKLAERGYVQGAEDVNSFARLLKDAGRIPSSIEESTVIYPTRESLKENESILDRLMNPDDQLTGVTFGTFLRSRRNELRPLQGNKSSTVTQVQMAEIIGISADWYRKLEQDGARNYSLELLNKVGIGLGLNADQQEAFTKRYTPRK